MKDHRLRPGAVGSPECDCVSRQAQIKANFDPAEGGMLSIHL